MDGWGAVPLLLPRRCCRYLEEGGCCCSCVTVWRVAEVPGQGSCCGRRARAARAVGQRVPTGSEHGSRAEPSVCGPAVPHQATRHTYTGRPRVRVTRWRPFWHERVGCARSNGPPHSVHAPSPMQRLYLEAVHVCLGALCIQRQRVRRACMYTVHLCRRIRSWIVHFYSAGARCPARMTCGRPVRHSSAPPRPEHSGLAGYGMVQLWRAVAAPCVSHFPVCWSKGNFLCPVGSFCWTTE